MNIFIERGSTSKERQMQYSKNVQSSAEGNSADRRSQKLVQPTCFPQRRLVQEPKGKPWKELETENRGKGKGLKREGV